MDEIKRMQQLAGLDEAFINAPNNSIPVFIDEDSPRAQILVNAYYIEYRAKSFNGYAGGAVIEPDLFRLPTANEGFLYIKKGTHGWYDKEEEVFESEEDENTVHVREEYIKYI